MDGRDLELKVNSSNIRKIFFQSNNANEDFDEEGSEEFKSIMEGNL
jgi:hypothetical protein